MSDTLDPSAPPVLVNAQYIKDLSFESPNAPMILANLGTDTPDINVGVNINGQPLQGNLFEIVLHLNVEAKLGDKVAFIAELAYGGIFTVNVPEEHVQAVLLIECPRLLFPFARNIIADVTRDGGFPPMLLQPIDFVQMFRSRMEQENAGHA